MKLKEKKVPLDFWGVASLYENSSALVDRATADSYEQVKKGEKRVRIRTVIVAVLLTIAAILCYLTWAPGFATMIMALILSLCVIVGVLLRVGLFAYHKNKEKQELADVVECKNTYSVYTASGDEETPEEKFINFAIHEVGHKTTRRVWCRNALIVFLAVAIGWMLMVRFVPDAPVDPVGPTFNTNIDDNIGDITQKDQQEEIDRLNQKLAEGYITFSINKSPVFASGTAAGNLNIINLEENNYPQVVELYMMDGEGQVTDQQIYQSGVIPVGKAVETAKLNVDLSAGQYQVMAVIHAVNGETGEVLGTVQTPLNITISN